MDAEAILTRDNRLDQLEDTLFQAQFYLRQAMQCKAGDNRDAILRITEQTLQSALEVPVFSKIIDL